MIAAVAFVVCLGLVSAVPRRDIRAASDCPNAFANVPNPCINNPDKLFFFPHPTDNTKILQCDLFGRMYIIQCPAGEAYNPETTACTVKTLVVAPVKTTMAPTTQKPTTKAPVVTDAPATGNLDNPCSADNILKGNLYFAYAGSRTKFIECDQNGNPTLLDCPAGLVWEQTRLSCVYQKSLVGVAPGTNTGTGMGTGMGSGTGSVTVDGNGLNGVPNPCTAASLATGSLFFPHPDANKFIQCDLWGDVFVNNCPTGLVWNNVSKTCASAYVVIPQSL